MQFSRVADWQLLRVAGKGLNRNLSRWYREFRSVCSIDVLFRNSERVKARIRGISRVVSKMFLCLSVQPV